MRLNISIAQRIALAFSLVVILAGVAGYISVRYINSQNDTLATTRNSNTVIAALDTLHLQWWVVAASVDNMLVTRQTGLTEANLNAELDLFSAQLQALNTLPFDQLGGRAENQILVNNLEDLGSELGDAVNIVVSAAQNNQWATAQAQRHTDMASLQRRFGDTLAQLTTNVNTDIADAVSQAENTQENLRTLAVIVVIAASVLGLFAIFAVTYTIRRGFGRLLVGAQAVESGNLSVRVPATSRDEFGELGSAFNAMSEQLEQLVGGLEARIEARTKDLQVAARVSEQTSTILDPEELLPQLADLTKESFNLYHAHLYLIDSTGDRLVLAAGAGEIGRHMRTAGHSIPFGAERSLVARAARNNAPLIVDDTAREPGFLPNPLLPKTRSEAAFPLAVGRRVLGVLDVQSDQTGYFDTDRVNVLTTMARQVAISIDNARLFSEIERTGRHEQALSAITSQMQQATSVDDVLQTAVRELGKALRVPRTAIELHIHTEESGSEPATSAAPDSTIAPDLETARG